MHSHVHTRMQTNTHIHIIRINKNKSFLKADTKQVTFYPFLPPSDPGDLVLFETGGRMIRDSPFPRAI